MRLDKWLKVSRLIKRRTVANEACDNERVSVNGRPVRASYDVKVGDQVELYSDGRVLSIAALVYLGPVVLFLLGYLLPSGLPEGWRYLCGILGFALGLAGAVACDRRVQRGRTISYQITRKL